MNFVKKFVRILFSAVFSLLGAAGWIFQCALQIVTVFLILCVAAGGVVFIKVKPHLEEARQVAYDTLAQMERDDFSMLSDTEIFDKDGKRIGIINAGHYEYADISDISLNLQNAYIAQEDRRFKSHNGVDWIATFRAGLALVKHRGAITQGGSTITQQIIKNTYLTQEKTFTRKMVEILLAPEIEKAYSKADIMEFYCNTNFYGHRCYGVQTASRYYFGKDAADLEVHEAAVLVGISNSPSAYDPITHPDASRKKRDEVLHSMLEVDLLSQEAYDKAVSQPLRILQQEQEGTDDSYLTSYAVHCAALELMKQEEFPFRYTFADKEDYDQYIERYTTAYNEKNDSIRNGGYQIYTSLDQDIQQMLQTHLDDVLSPFTEIQENGKFALQGAGVIVDNQTNYVVAIVGGRGTEDQFNRGYLSARQPGSTIKPLIDYGPAFDTGEYYPSRIIDDHKWEDGPSNSGGRYYGPVTVREALNRSLNTVAWQVLEDIGIDTGLSYLDNMEFHRLTYVDNGVQSLSIGGFTNGVRVVDMAKGFSTLANGGLYNDRTCILKIQHEHEGVLTSRIPSITRQVYGSDSAFMLTDVLKGTFTSPYGTGRGLGLSGGMPAAGKTGTTNSSKDTWFCGYTRYYTAAVWVGYDTPRAMPGVYGSTYAGAIWKNVMNQLHENLEPWDWERPETVVKDTYNSVTGERLHPALTSISREDAESRQLMSTVIAAPDVAAAEPVYTAAAIQDQDGDVYRLHVAQDPDDGVYRLHAAQDPDDGVYRLHTAPGPGTSGPGISQNQEAGPGASSQAPAGPGVDQEIGPGVGLDSGSRSVPEPTRPAPIGPGIPSSPDPSSESAEAGEGSEAAPETQGQEEESAQQPSEAMAEEAPPQPPLLPAPSVVYLADGLYIEPDYAAGTNLVDYFSTSSQFRAQQNISEKNQKKLTDQLEEMVAAFENKTIDSVEDVSEVRSQHQAISENLTRLEDGEKRKELFDRTEIRWEEFSQIMDSMSDAIRVYEEKQELARQQERRRADQEAEGRRKEEEIQNRVAAFETALEMVESIQYRSSEANDLVTTAIDKLGELYGYTATDGYRARLEAAIARIRTLPTQAQWNTYQAQQKDREQQELYDLYQTEQYYWTPSKGPGVR